MGMLDGMGVGYELHRHPAVFTVEEAQVHTRHLPGAHIKNLFLKDKPLKDGGALALVVALDDRSLDLKALGKAMGRRWSFGSPDLLREVLGVEPGSVTPLALVNAVPGRVRVVLDAAIFDHPLVNPHPLTNTMTLAMLPGDLLRCITSWGHDYAKWDLGAFLRVPGVAA